MWLKNKQLAAPLSVKLTALYAFILSCILLFTSLITVVGLYYMLYIQADNAFNRSIYSVSHYLQSGNGGSTPTQLLLKKNLFPSGILLRIVDDQNNPVFDNMPASADLADFLPEDQEAMHTRLLAPLNRNTKIICTDRHLAYYLPYRLTVGDRSYQLHFIKPMAEQLHFLTILIQILMATNAIGLLIAVISGMYISRRILHPIRDITKTAKEIEVSDLDRRIETTGDKDELQELAKTFNHMLDRIQTGFEQQRRFVSDASHELRTPVTVISGYANMLDRWGKQDPAALEEGITAIRSEAANMYELIEKLLFLAKADHQKQALAKTTLTMQPLIDEIVQETRLIAPEHHILLAGNDPGAVYADASAIKEMLRIFIENSIKYTPAGKSISIASKNTGSHLDISIEDTGIGIPEEDQPNIFDRFYRVDKSRTKTSGGTGLGLSIARWIADQHVSTIRLASKPGDGTKITVSIPLD